MNLRLPLFLLVILASSRPTLVDKARTILSSVKAVADRPYDQDFLKENVAIQGAIDLTKKIVPFADLFLVFIKVGLDQKQMAGLTALTQGMIKKLNTIETHFSTLYKALRQLHLLHDYKVSVTRPIKDLLSSIDHYVATRTEVSRDELSRKCVTETQEIMNRLSEFAEECSNSTLNADAAVEIHDLLNQFHYKRYDLTPQEERQFKAYFITVYYYLDTALEEFQAKIQDFTKTRNKVMKNKVEVLRDLVDSLHMIPRNSTDDCIPYNIFLLSDYSRSKLMEFITIVKGQLDHLKYITYFCSMVTNPKSRAGRKTYVNVTEALLPQIYNWTNGWPSSLLESTWPKLEAAAVRDVINHRSSFTYYSIAEEKEVYEDVLFHIKKRMVDMGHQNFARGYVLATDDHPPLREKRYELCNTAAPTSCAIARTNGALCMLSRVNITSHDTVARRMRHMEKWIAHIEPKMKEELDRRLFKVMPLEIILQKFDNVGIDFSNFTTHSSLDIVRHTRYLKRCTNFYAMNWDEKYTYMGSPLMHKIQYHNDGDWATYCHHFTFFVGI